MIVIESDLRDATKNRIKFEGTANELIDEMDQLLRTVYGALTEEADRAAFECRIAFTLFMIQKSPELAKKSDPKEIRKQMLKVFTAQLAEMETECISK